MSEDEINGSTNDDEVSTDPTSEEAEIQQLDEDIVTIILPTINNG